MISVVITMSSLDYYLKQDPYIVGSALYEIQMAIQLTSR